MVQHMNHADTVALGAFALIAFGGLHLWLKMRNRHAGVPWLVWPTVLGVLAVGMAMTERTAQETTTRLKRAVLGFAPTYAVEIERLGHRRIALNTPADNTTYLAIIAAEKRWLAANPVVNDIYTFRRKEAGKAFMAVDSETDYDHNGRYEGEREQRTAIGEVWAPSGPTVEAAYGGRGGFDAAPYTDRWGTWVSAYWPLRDAAGHVEAVVGVDYAAAAWASEVAAARYGTIALTSVVLLILFAATVLAALQRAELAARQITADALREARDAAESANALKSDFLARMSHEIRTPMNGVMGVTELLLSTQLDDKQRQFGELIQRSATNLLHIINDILDYSKIEAEKLNLESIEFDPSQLIKDVGELLANRAHAKHLAFDMSVPLDCPRVLVGDPSRLRQVLVNLLSNAIKFTEQGAVNLVTTWRNDQDKLWLRCEVSDSGIGIGPTHDDLFQPFTQADSSITRRFGGTGLGLAICKRIVDLMQGQIGYKPRDGGGTTFWFDVPLTAIKQDADALRRHAHTSLNGTHGALAVAQPARWHGHALLAEDNSVNQIIAQEMLGSFGFTVSTVQDGQSAVTAVTDLRSTFDVVLMDCEMPILDGQSAAKQIREFEATHHRPPIPIIALTAHAEDSARDACLAAGMNDYLKKPFTATQLHQVLAHCLTMPAALSAE